MPKRILVLDLDTPCFAASSVTEQRSILVTHKPSMKTKVFKNRTEFKERLTQLGKIQNIEEYEVQDQQEAEPIENACHILKSMVNNIQEAVQADESMYFISGKDNFRDSLPLPTKYKSSRVDMLRPLLLKQVREFATNKFKAEICNGDEADDRVVYRSYELQRSGHIPIVSTVDKDVLAYSGLLVYNQDKPEKGIFEIPQLGSLWIDEKNKVRGCGFLWYCVQILVGDITDTFKPTELCGIKFGEKSAYNLLKDCKTEQEALETVIQQYKKWYPSAVTYTAWDGQQYTKDHIEILDMYHKCARMKSHEFDELDFIAFAKQHGVNLQ